MTGHEITPFLFEGEALVRVVPQDGEPWFVAVDVCRVLGIKNVAQAVDPLDDDEKGLCSTYTPGGNQELLAITEGGLYTLILRSRQATTPGTVQHRFRKWVTAEVLPSIRKTGRYGGDRKGRRRERDPFVDRNRSVAMAINSVTGAVAEIRRCKGPRAASMAATELYKKIDVDLGNDAPEQREFDLGTVVEG